MLRTLLICVCLAFSSSAVSTGDKTAQSQMLGLRTSVYFVSDIVKAKDWYTRAFGIAPYFDEPYYVGFNIRGFELALMPEEPDRVKTNNVLPYWGVEDIAGTVKRLVEMGASIHSEPANVGGEIMVAVVVDPYGNHLGLIYNPIFKPE